MTTLNKLTKAELVALLKDRNEELAGMRQALGDAHHDLKRLRAQSPTPRTRVVLNDAAGVPTRFSYTPHVLPAHFAAARDAAMRMGVAVKVTA
jgi:hypothetical protein